MPPIKILLSPLSKFDLEEIWVYSYKKWSLEQADKYQDELFAGFNLISNDTTIGKSIDHVLSGYRRYKVNHHYIFYTTTKTHLYIIRILHEKMDMLNHLT